MSVASTVPAVSTWEVAAVDGGARRPSLGDVGGVNLTDEDPAPPQDGTEPSAVLLNQWEYQLAAIGRVVAAAVITVDVATGTPFIDKVTAPSLSLVSGDFVVTDNAAGDFTLSILATKLPASAADPTATVNFLGNCNAVATRVVPPAIAGNADFRVQTYLAGALSDKRVTVVIY